MLCKQQLFLHFTLGQTEPGLILFEDTTGCNCENTNRKSSSVYFLLGLSQLSPGVFSWEPKQQAGSKVCQDLSHRWIELIMLPVNLHFALLTSLEPCFGQLLPDSGIPAGFALESAGRHSWLEHSSGASSSMKRRFPDGNVSPIRTTEAFGDPQSGSMSRFPLTKQNEEKVVFSKCLEMKRGKS